MACLMIVGFAACGNSQKAPTESTSVDESPSAQNEEKENKIELDLDSDQNLYYQFAEGLAAVRKNKKWGYVDKHGIVVIPFSFDEARGFSSGLACVKKNGMYGFVDKTGEVVIPFIYDWAISFKNGVSFVRKDGCYGAIRANGDIAIPIIYDNVDVNGLNEGLVYVSKGSHGGFVDKNGKTVVPFIYGSNILNSVFKDGLAVVYDKQGNYIIDKKGSVKYECSSPYQFCFNNVYSEGVFRIIKNEGGYSKVGFIDQDGDVRVPFENEDLMSFFSEGLATYKKDGKFGYIDKHGNVVIATFFDWACPFKYGLALVQKTHKSGYINKEGDIVVPIIYDIIGEFSSDKIAYASMNGKWGYIDIKGEVVVPFIYDKASSFSEGLAFVERDGKTYIVDSLGREQ